VGFDARKVLYSFALTVPFRRFATRYDRRAAYFLALIHLAAAMLWMR
jgi:transposase